MADPTDPWAAFNPQPAPSAASPFGGRPVIQEGPPNTAPKTTYNPLSPEEIHTRGLNPAHSYQISSEGKIDDLGDNGTTGQPTIGASNVSGNDYLKTLDPATANMVKALAEGRKAFPSGSALRAPYWQNMLAHVSNYDPGFDEVNYTSRAGTRRDFTSGKAANNIRALNTAIGHLGHLEEQISGTASHGLVPFNAVENAVLRATGDAGPTNFDTTVSALAGELTAVYRGSGGAEADLQRYIQQLSPNASREQKEGAIRNIVGLLKSRLDALNDQYRQGMGTTAQSLQLLDPQAQLIVQHLGGFDAAGAPDNGPPPPPMGPPNNGTSESPDPQGSAFIDNMVKQGVPFQQAVTNWQDFNQQRGLNVQIPFGPDQYNAAVAFAHDHPNVEYHPTQAITSRPISSAEQAVSNAAQSAPGVALISAGNALAGGIPLAAAGDQGTYFEQAAGANHPNAQLAGQIVGGTAGALAGEAALAKAGMGAGFGRSLIADTGYGAVSGASANPQDRTGGAIMGGLAGAGGSIAGQALARGGAAALRGVTSKDVTGLAEAGVQPQTVGQMVSQSGTVGKAIKGVEDRLQGFSGVGDMIRARRIEGLKSFNAKTFDEALKPIGASVDGAVGEEAVQKASQAVSNAFSAALKGKSAVPDDQFITAARGPLERLARNKRVGSEIVDSIEGLTQGLFDENTGAISGENMQAFMDGLRQVREGYRGDPLYQTLIKPSVQGIENAVEGMFRRQAPEVMPQFNRAKAAYRRLSTLADAVNRASETEGVFAPSQLGGAAKANAKKYNGSIASASGDRPFFSLQRSAQNVLPSKVPDSGTAGRVDMAKRLGGGASLTATGAGLGYLGGDTKTGAEGGLGLTALLAALYTKRGQAGMATLLLSRSPKAREIAQKLLDRAPMAGAAGTALTQTNDGP